MSWSTNFGNLAQSVARDIIPTVGNIVGALDSEKLPASIRPLAESGISHALDYLYDRSLENVREPHRHRRSREVNYPVPDIYSPPNPVYFQDGGRQTREISDRLAADDDFKRLADRIWGNPWGPAGRDPDNTWAHGGPTVTPTIAASDDQRLEPLGQTVANFRPFHSEQVKHMAEGAAKYGPSWLQNAGPVGRRAQVTIDRAPVILPVTPAVIQKAPTDPVKVKRRKAVTYERII